MKAHVICCNVVLVFAVIGNEDKTQQKLEELYMNHRDSYTSSFNRYVYDDSHYWHIQTVEAE